MPCYITYSGMPNQSFAGLLHCATRPFPLNKRNFLQECLQKKGLETAAGIAPFFQICKKKKGLETAAGIAPFFLDFCSL